ncbi:MAG: MBL fold metallo-hydrolase [Deltaproteobacteria bacterium]|nr:MAG: MBL fold metallo-hydrolase [Deltaproteobacteria bacterium]
MRVREVGEGDVFALGGRTFRVLETDGHDRYHVSYLEVETGRLFLGDVVLATPVPLSPWHGDSAGQWLRSVRRVEELGEGQGEDARALGVRAVRIIPGHGMPSTLVAPSAARARNIFLKQFEAVRSALGDGRPTHPVEAVEGMLGDGRGRNAQRTSALVSTGLQILLELAEREAVERLDDGLFVAHGPVPPWEGIWPEGAK